MRAKCLMVSIIMVLEGSSAMAEVIGFSSSVPVSTTNWTQTISVPKFDPNLGTLQRVRFDLSGQVEGSAQFESLDVATTTVTMKLAADIRLRRPDGSDLVISLPVADTSDVAAPYDGTIDFAGPSGESYFGLSAGDSDFLELFAPLSPVDEANFVGTGQTVDLIIRATGTSRGSGAGNLVLLFGTSAAADMSVTYEYVPIPEPGTAALIGASMAALGFCGRRGRRWALGPAPAASRRASR